MSCRPRAARFFAHSFSLPTPAREDQTEHLSVPVVAGGALARRMYGGAASFKVSGLTLDSFTAINNSGRSALLTVR
jgi:hypothetical protein